MDVTLKFTRVERRWSVVGAPTVDKKYNSVSIVPEFVDVTFLDGQFQGAQVYGRRAKKDGSPGEAGANTYFSATDRDLPGWLVPLTDFNYQP